MYLSSRSFTDGQAIPARYAFGRRGSPVALSDNCNPHLAWGDVPDGVHSFALTCIDLDAPSRADDVNQADRRVPAELARVEFVHWLMADLPAACRELAEGACSSEVVPGGKASPMGPAGSVQGENDYTAWFAADPAMQGHYHGYDGPCPPWNDSVVHRYVFRLYALDTATLGLHHGFTVAALRQALHGHVLAEASLTGTYTLS